MKALLILLITALTGVQAASADTVKYVRDVVYVPLRSGPSIQHRILRSAESGTALTVIGAEPEQGYVQVRTEDGTEGWMEAQYLVDQPVARDRLAAASAALDKLRGQYKELRDQLHSANADQSESSKAISDLKSANAQLSSELERIKTVSSNAMALDRQNRQLHDTANQLGAQVQALTAQNAKLEAEKKSRAFMNGAYAVVMGVVITLLVPRLWPRKRRSDWA